MQPIEHVKKRHGQPPEKPVVDRQIEVGRDLLKALLIFRARIEVGTHFAATTRFDTKSWRDEADRVGPVGFPFSIVAMRLIGRRHPRGKEIMLKYGDPTAGQGTIERLLVEVLELDLHVAFVGGGRGGTEVGLRAQRERRIALRLQPVAAQLAEEAGNEGFAALVVDPVTHVYEIVAAMEREHLLDANRATCVCQHDIELRARQLVGVGRRLVAGSLSPDIGSVGAVEAALRHVGPPVAGIQQRVRLVRPVAGDAMLQQLHANDIAAEKIQPDLERIRGDRHEPTVTSGFHGRRRRRRHRRFVFRHHVAITTRTRRGLGAPFRYVGH